MEDSPWSPTPTDQGPAGAGQLDGARVQGRRHPGQRPNRALEQVGFKLVAAGLTYCLAHPEEAEASGYPLDVVEQMFLKLA